MLSNKKSNSAVWSVVIISLCLSLTRSWWSKSTKHQRYASVSARQREQQQQKMNIFSDYNFTLSGSCAPQFEPLRRELEEYFRSGMESRAQLCVFVGDEKVIGKQDESDLCFILIQNYIFQICTDPSTTMTTSAHQILYLSSVLEKYEQKYFVFFSVVR